MPLPDVPPGSVDALAVDYGRIILEHDPVSATSLGLHDRDGELPPVSRESVEGHAHALSELSEAIRRHETEQPDDELDRRGLLALITSSQLALRDNAYRNPYLRGHAAVSSVLSLLIGAGMSDEARRSCVPERCRAIPEFLHSIRDLVDIAAVPPLWAQLAEGSARGAAQFFRSAVPAAVADVEGDAGAAADAFDAYADWLSEEVFPGAAGDFAAGEERLGELLRDVHLLDDTPHEVLAKGEELVERYESLLREEAGRADWRAELDRIKSDHPDADGLLDAYRDELARLQRFCLDSDLVSDPDAEATLEATPEPLRPIMGYAAYFPPGPFDDALSGQLWVTPPPQEEGLRDHAFALIPSITAHEGYPGHHLQITSVGRLPSVTRRQHISTLMIEGWGLYVEELMSEVGYLERDARIAQLSMSLWRACRIVIDMSLHTGTFSFDESVAYLVDRVGLNQATARTEVSRYTMTPTQPFSYLTGAEEIRRIRAAYRERTGASLREFHDALLSYGHLPPALAAEGLLSE
jgi:uncharacterized protein (DUF885 family)